MPNDPSAQSRERTNIALGFFVLLLLGVALFFGVRAIYRWVVPSEPEGTLALSAYFEPGEGEAAAQLRIEGQVQIKGAAVRAGVARVTVNKLIGDFRQSFLLPLKVDGQFSVVDNPALRKLNRDDKLYIEAEAWADGSFIASEIVYLAARKPLIARDKLLVGTCVLIALLLAGFLWAFTGNEASYKNRLAISFTYLVIAVYLAAPLVAPVVLTQVYPDLQEIMRETPVGLVPGVAAQKDEVNPEPQWYLNIGGVVTPAEGKPSQIAGGLIIPFFILVLSTIGGAINMTRKVPEYHDDAQHAADPLTRLVSRSVSGLRSLVGRPAAGAGGAEAGVQRPVAAGDGELLPWRIGLVKEYMYLVSAPFLAIATYYLLLWLDMTQKPVVVLVSFSVGLMSDRIVERIIEIVGSVIGRKPKEEDNAGRRGGKAGKNKPVKPPKEPGS